MSLASLYDVFGRVAMLLARLSRLKFIVALLLPYAVFAIGSEFLHDHGAEHISATAALSQARCGQEQLRHGRFPSACPDDHHICPACAWAASNVSSPQVAPAVGHVTDVIAPIVLQYFAHSSGVTRLACSRGPPLG